MADVEKEPNLCLIHIAKGLRTYAGLSWCHPWLRSFTRLSPGGEDRGAARGELAAAAKVPSGDGGGGSYRRYIGVNFRDHLRPSSEYFSSDDEDLRYRSYGRHTSGVRRRK